MMAEALDPRLLARERRRGVPAWILMMLDYY